MRPGVRLGIDVGSVRVGVAACDPSGLLAHPVTTLIRDHEGAGDLLEIVGLVADAEAIEVVVGLPLTLSGAEGAAAIGARAYAAALADALSRTSLAAGVRLVDERLSTVDGHRALRESGLAGRRQRAVIDQVAATVILQSALDTERATTRAPGEIVGERRRKPRTKDGRA